MSSKQIERTKISDTSKQSHKLI